MKFFHRIRTQFRKKELDQELSEELAFHIQKETQENIASGMSAEDAHYAALRKFGGIDQVKEECRDAWGLRFIETLLQDLRFGLRMLAKNPGFTVVAVLTLALGIGANTAIFSVISGILLRKPPIRDPDGVVTVSCKNTIRGSDLQLASAPDFESWRERNHVFEDMAAAAADDPFTLTGGREPETVLGDRVTANYFSVLGVFPALGRAFLPSEGQAGHERVVILSYALWRERYDSSAGVIGKQLELNAEPYTVIGVMPPGTDMAFFAPRLWTPLVLKPHDLSVPARQNRYLNIFARLKPSVKIRNARAEMDSIAGQFARDHPETDKGWSATVLTLQEFLIRAANVRRGLVLLMVTVSFVLLIACANIAGLLLARGAARGREMAIRSAVGASRSRLARQMLTESLLIGVAGGTLGLLMSEWGVNLLRVGLSFNFYGRQMAAGIHLDRPTLLFNAVTSLVTALLFGLVPAMRASGTDLAGTLNEGGRGGSVGHARSRMRSVLVATEIALAVTLLAGMGVLMREFIREFTQNQGFNPNHVLTAGIHLVSRNYQQNQGAQMAFFEHVTETMGHLPGVESASVTSAVPLEGSAGNTFFNISGEAQLPESSRPLADYFLIGAGYFRTMEIPLLEGRDFLDSDDAHSQIVAVVNQEFARRFLPKRDAVGQRIQVDSGHRAWAEIVGIVGNVNDFGGQLAPSAQIYEPYLQFPVADMSLVVRSRADPAALAPMLRRAVWSVDKNQPVGDLRGGVLTMQDIANQNMGGDKLMGSLLGIFAGLALTLAAVGLYGVIVYAAQQRTHEIGIRMALGAREGDVLGLVLWQGVFIIAVGCGTGLVLALPLPKLFAALFNGMAPQGGLVSIVATVIGAAVSLLACYIPARRAAKVDPMVALRHE